MSDITSYWIQNLLAAANLWFCLEATGCHGSRTKAAKPRLHHSSAAVLWCNWPSCIKRVAKLAYEKDLDVSTSVILLEKITHTISHMKFLLLVYVILVNKWNNMHLSVLYCFENTGVSIDYPSNERDKARRYLAKHSCSNMPGENSFQFWREIPTRKSVIYSAAINSLPVILLRSIYRAF